MTPICPVFDSLNQAFFPFECEIFSSLLDYIQWMNIPDSHLAKKKSQSYSSTSRMDESSGTFCIIVKIKSNKIRYTVVSINF